MFKKSKESHSDDKQLLLNAMQQLIDGSYHAIDTSAFSDPEVAEKLNEVITALKKSNNNYVMRMNESMEHIGDNSCVKEMIEQVMSQTSSIQDMSASSKTFEASIHSISEEVGHIRDDAGAAIEVSKASVNNMNETITAVSDSVEQIRGIHEKVAVFQEKIEQITNIIDMVKKLANQSNLLALNASIEAARAGEAGRGFAIVAGQVKELSSNTAHSADMVVDYVGELEESLAELKELVDSTTSHLEQSNDKVHSSVRDINSMSEHMNLINERIRNIHDAVNTQTSVTESFVRSIESMAGSYTILERDCFATGEHLRSISRYVDNARSDMARGFSDLTVQDWIRVFQIDHHILTWRIYNHIAGFEQLKITQLNNPAGCKLGKWITAQTDARITGSTQFREVKKLHEELHKHGCDSWYAAEEGNRTLALHHFDLALESYQKFYQAIEKFKTYMRSIGHTEETPIKPFQK
ncbi:MAG: methyl-accepting chemotaxis protein [Lachnospiraceae bacterium]